MTRLRSDRDELSLYFRLYEELFPLSQECRPLFAAYQTAKEHQTLSEFLCEHDISPDRTTPKEACGQFYEAVRRFKQERKTLEIDLLEKYHISYNLPEDYEALIARVNTPSLNRELALGLQSLEENLKKKFHTEEPIVYLLRVQDEMTSLLFPSSPVHEQRIDELYTFFAQADRFLAVVRWVESVRKRLSPQTRTDLDEVGSQTGTDGTGMPPSYVAPPIPNSYWNLSGATFAYVYAETAKLGIDIVGESQMTGYPTQWPSVSLVDWNTGQPNARFWVLKLLHSNFVPGTNSWRLEPTRPRFTVWASPLRPANVSFF